MDLGFLDTYEYVLEAQILKKQHFFYQIKNQRHVSFPIFFVLMVFKEINALRNPKLYEKKIWR